MQRVRVKICGITRIADMQAAARVGADAIGLVFYPPSPRVVSIGQAAAICHATPAFVSRVGLFVNPTYEQVCEVLEQVPLDILQFHGDEPAVFCRRFGVPLIDGGTVRLPRLIGMSRAMDMILTGRAVDASEAQAIGLVNRVVSVHNLRDSAEQLALQIAGFPQECLRNDRRSAYQQWGMNEEHAMHNEFTLGLKTLSSGETLAGAQRFEQGRGRHGEPES